MKQIAVKLDRDGVINVEKTFVLSPEEMELYPGSADAVRRINDAGYLTIVVTNQSAVARDYITTGELEKIHGELKRLLSTEAGAKVDAIYYCPHRERLDEEGGNPEYIIDCECRKPKPGMLYQAAEDFDIDLNRSYLIGDSARDVLAGKRAGCTTIGLKTGHALKGIEQSPDYVFDDLRQAVDYILKNDR